MDINEKAHAPLLDLLNAYEHPQAAARDAYAHGTPVIGRIGTGIPEEIISASGGFATTLVPLSDAPTPVADGLMDPGEQQELRSLLDQIASPASSHLSLAVLASPYSGLSATVEDLRRAALLPNAVPTSYFELPAVGPNNLRHAENAVRDVAARVGSATGTPATHETLQAAIASTNRRRVALRTFVDLRRKGSPISGFDAIRVIGAASYLPSETFAPSLEALNAGLGEDAGLEGRPRILLVPSSPLTHDRAHAAIEDAGGLIVAEDDPLGSRAAEAPIREDDAPFRAIAEHYVQNLTGARVFPSQARLNWFHNEAIKPDVDAVIFYGQEPRYGWDYPAMRDYLHAHGKPHAFIRTDARTADGYARLQSETKAFLTEIMSGNGSAA